MCSCARSYLHVNLLLMQGVESLISDCFPKAGSSQDKQVPHTMITQLTVQLSSNRSSSDSSENDTTSMLVD